MVINTKSIISISDANQNFSKVAKLAEKFEEVVIFKNNRPKYLLITLDDSEFFDEKSTDDNVKEMSQKILKRFKPSIANLKMKKDEFDF